jgi:hypothetical protein
MVAETSQEVESKVIAIRSVRNSLGLRRTDVAKSKPMSSSTTIRDIVISFATAESLRCIQFNKAAGLTPDVLAPSFGNKESGDAVYRRAVELLIDG